MIGEKKLGKIHDNIPDQLKLYSFSFIKLQLKSFTVVVLFEARNINDR